MIVGVTSQNYKTITGHAGKTRRFLLFGRDETGMVVETARLDLPKEMAMHEFRGDVHPIDSCDVLITGGCGQGFIRRMAAREVRVIATSEEDPLTAAKAVFDDRPLPAVELHGH